jgi:hypothetical protein
MLPRLTLALNVAVLVCSAAAYAQQPDLASLASRPAAGAAPRFVNIGNEIIQSQTARPIPPRDIPAPPQSTASAPATDDAIPEAAPPAETSADMTSMPAESDAETEDVDPRLTYPYSVTGRRARSGRPGPVAGNPGDNPAYWPNYTRTRIMKTKRGG